MTHAERHTFYMHTRVNLECCSPHLATISTRQHGTRLGRLGPKTGCRTLTSGSAADMFFTCAVGCSTKAATALATSYVSNII